MKYYTWKLNWSSGEGISPTSYLNNNSTRLEPAFMIGDPTDPNSNIYGYLVFGTIEEKDLKSWNIVEISQEEMLFYAKNVNNEAILDSGFVVFPENLIVVRNNE